MRVRKRDGRLEDVNLVKISKAVATSCEGLSCVDPMRVAMKTVGGLYDGVTTKELDELSIRNAEALLLEEPEYSKLAARMLSKYIHKELREVGIQSLPSAMKVWFKSGLLNARQERTLRSWSSKLSPIMDDTRDDLFDYFGLRTVYDRYLLRDKETGHIVESPQMFFMRVAVALATSASEAAEFYELFSTMTCVPASPTLFNAGTTREQCSSCYLLDSPDDDIEAIYNQYRDIAKLSKFAGGIGVPYHRVRSRGSSILGTGGKSNGIVPFLKTLDSSIGAVNQGGRRKGAACVYLEPWHADVLDFLEMRDNTGDQSQRTYNLNLANWIPDLFMRRLEAGQSWSLFDPKDVPELPDLHGEAFDRAYASAEERGLAKKVLPASDLYARMMRTLTETGNGWMNFKDRCNAFCNQGGTVHSSNLCTEIIERTDSKNTAVCNLASLNLSKFVRHGAFDFEALAAAARTAVRHLDRVIDINLYPTEEARRSNEAWRPIGLGQMGLQDVFFMLRLPFDSDAAHALSTKISETILLHAMKASVELAKERGPFDRFKDSKTASGWLHIDGWDAVLSYPDEWEALRGDIALYGLRNSLLVAIAPTATIGSIAGVYECIEPQTSNVFKRETLSGDFMQINKYLVDELKGLGLWNEQVRSSMIQNNGSIQHIEEIPLSVRELYRTAWELSMRDLIVMARSRAPFVDQSQSLNLFMASPSIGKASSMYMFAWKSGLKTTYYLRSRPASEIAKTAVYTPSEAVVCSLENPEACEACQ